MPFQGGDQWFESPGGHHRQAAQEAVLCGTASFLTGGGSDGAAAAPTATTLPSPPTRQGAGACQHARRLQIVQSNPSAASVSPA